MARLALNLTSGITEFSSRGHRNISSCCTPGDRRFQNSMPKDTHIINYIQHITMIMIHNYCVSFWIYMISKTILFKTESGLYIQLVSFFDILLSGRMSLKSMFSQFGEAWVQGCGPKIYGESTCFVLQLQRRVNQEMINIHFKSWFSEY